MTDSCGRGTRERLEAREELILHPNAARSAASRGRRRPEAPCPIRPAFQHDRDRIIHSKSFRRLKHKTQVFLSPSGDHYRTRLTHTLEVSQIARTISRSVGLNEDLTEAVSLAHDLGHTPFGHAGEAVLNRISPGGFHHALQSLRVVDLLEKGGAGLNLTEEVRDGILAHTKGFGGTLPADGERPLTLEAEVVRVSDRIAYLNHDLDDALRAKVIAPGDLPADIIDVLGARHSARIDRMVRDVIGSTLGTGVTKVAMSPEVLAAVEALKEFLYRAVYENPLAHAEFRKASKVLEDLHAYYLEHPSELPEDLLALGRRGEEVTRLVCDHIAGMTDRFALSTFERLFIPQPWEG
jgi:dGTPase